MAQTTVSRFYKTRKKNVKDLGIKDFPGLSSADEKIQTSTTNKQTVSRQSVKNITKQTEVTSFFSNQIASVSEGKLEAKSADDTAVKSKPEIKVKKPATKNAKSVKNSRSSKTKAAHQKNVSGQLDIAELLKTKIAKDVLEESKPGVTKICTNKASAESNSKNALLHSPSKRNIPISEELTPSKKKLLLEENDADKTASKLCCIPSQSKQTSARKKLQLDSISSNVNSKPVLSPFKVTTPTKNAVSSPRKVILSSPAKLDTLLLQSRAKLMLSPKLDELKKSLQSFSEKASKIKEFQSNPYKINAPISPSKTSETAVPPTKLYAHERFQHIISVERATSLILPTRYKLLLEIFRSMDVVVSMLHNRKEQVTFEKVREGVQKMMKRTFTKHHLGQILTIFPTAYNLTLEKCKFSAKKSDADGYQLVITPNLAANEGGKKKSKGNTFTPVLPLSLTERENTFSDNLLKAVKIRHQEFLRKQNFPLVPVDHILRWHPKFPLDSVPDVQPSSLPEPPESKIHTARDVLNKVKGSFRHNKVEKALATVVEESTSANVTLELKDVSNSKPVTPNNALKGICPELLEKIRARESAKLLETMTQTPEQTKRLAMLDRLPRIVNILWHYFIAERKAAVPVDIAVEKIIHSCNSLESPEIVKDHLKLITETYPGWMTFIEIRKGVYITIDKKKNINNMLNNCMP